MRTTFRRARFTIILTGAMLLAFALAGGVGSASASGGATIITTGNLLGNLCERLPRACRTVTSTATTVVTQSGGEITNTITIAQSTRTVTRTARIELCQVLPFLCRTATTTTTRTTRVSETFTEVTVVVGTLTVTTTVSRNLTLPF